MGVRAAMLRFLFPQDERERMALRRQSHEAQASAEDLSRTTRFHAPELAKRLEECRRCENYPFGSINGEDKHGS